jgi:hypothetical protein
VQAPLGNRPKADEALQQLRKIMSKLKLAVNEEKTRICRVPGRRGRLPGLHVRTNVFCENRSGAPGIAEQIFDIVGDEDFAARTYARPRRLGAIRK